MQISDEYVGPFGDYDCKRKNAMKATILDKVGLSNQRSQGYWRVDNNLKLARSRENKKTLISDQ